MREATLEISAGWDVMVFEEGRSEVVAEINWGTLSREADVRESGAIVWMGKYQASAYSQAGTVSW